MSNIAGLVVGWVAVSAILTPLVTMALFTHPRIR